MASQAEAPEANYLFDDAEDRFDGLLAQFWGYCSLPLPRSFTRKCEIGSCPTASRMKCTM
jgi:hypothetical protein